MWDTTSITVGTDHVWAGLAAVFDAIISKTGPDRWSCKQLSVIGILLAGNGCVVFLWVSSVDHRLGFLFCVTPYLVIFPTERVVIVSPHSQVIFFVCCNYVVISCLHEQGILSWSMNNWTCALCVPYKGCFILPYRNRLLFYDTLYGVFIIMCLPFYLCN